MARRKLEPQDENGALATRRRIKLTKADRERLHEERLAEAAAALFLDLESPRKWTEVAEALNISLDTLKNLTRGELFQQKYDALMAELGHDPRYKAVQAGMADLLPVALRQLEGLIRTGPPQVKMQAIKFLFETSGVKVKPPDESDDRARLAEFLQKANITQNNIQITLDPEYAAGVQRFLSQEAPIEGEFAETAPGEPAPQSLD
jgi:hypothetical protein